MKILFLAFALLSAVLLTVPSFLNRCTAQKCLPVQPIPTVETSSEPMLPEEPVVKDTETEALTVQSVAETAEQSTQSSGYASSAPQTDTVISEEVTTEPIAQTPEPDTPVIDPGYDRSITLTVSGEEGCYSVSLHEYLIGVVMAEMPVYFHREALRAQAVAARSYLLYRLDRGYDIFDYGSSCTAHFSEEEGRAFFGDVYDTVWAAAAAAVEDTNGEGWYYDDDICCAAYHSMSYGRTEDAAAVWGGETPYLTSVDTPEPAHLDGMMTEALFDEEQLCRLLGVKEALPFVFSNTPSGRVSEVKTASGEVFSGERFRSLLGLRSVNITFTEEGEDRVLLCVRGYGHGVGMSQYGADIYADAGWSYKAILSHYYPHATLGLLS